MYLVRLIPTIVIVTASGCISPPPRVEYTRGSTHAVIEGPANVRFDEGNQDSGIDIASGDRQPPAGFSSPNKMSDLHGSKPPRAPLAEAARHLEAQIDEHRDLLVELQKVLDGREAELQNYQRQIKNMLAQRDELRDQLDVLNADYATLTTRHKELTDRSADLDTQVGGRRKELSEIKQDIETLRGEKDRLSTEVTALRAETKRLRTSPEKASATDNKDAIVLPTVPEVTSGDADATAKAAGSTEAGQAMAVPDASNVGGDRSLPWIVSTVGVVVLGIAVCVYMLIRPTNREYAVELRMLDGETNSEHVRFVVNGATEQILLSTGERPHVVSTGAVSDTPRLALCGRRLELIDERIDTSVVVNNEPIVSGRVRLNVGDAVRVPGGDGQSIEFVLYDVEPISQNEEPVASMVEAA